MTSVPLYSSGKNWKVCILSYPMRTAKLAVLRSELLCVWQQFSCTFPPICRVELLPWGLIFSQVLLTCLAAICNGLSGQRRLGFYKKISRRGLEMSNSVVEGTGVMGGTWHWFKQIATTGRSLFPEKCGNCCKFFFFPVSRSALSWGTGEVCSFPASSVLRAVGTNCSIKKGEHLMEWFYGWYLKNSLP